MARIEKRIIAVALTLAMTLASVCGGVRIHGVSAEVRIARAAESQGKYVKSIVISNASDKGKAEAELGEEYTVLDTDFGKSAGTHAWIGYSTTDDATQAITGIKVMDMEGNFNYSDYEKMLKKQKDLVNEQMDAVVPAVKEYAKNYDDRCYGAVRMYRMLNCFYEDDSDKDMGDYLLEAGRRLNQNPDDAVYDDLQKVIMQGGDTQIQAIEGILMMALDGRSGEHSWLIRMSEMGPKGLENIYKLAYPKKSKSALKNLMRDDLDDSASLILENLPAVRESFKTSEGSDLWKAIEAGDEDDIDKVIDEKVNTEDAGDVDENMSDDEAVAVVSESINDSVEASDMGGEMVDSTLIMLLQSIPYGDDTSMYDFFMREDLKSEDLYPMAYLLSTGQKNLMEDVGLYNIFTSVLAEGSAEPNDEDDLELTDELEGVSQSVYEGVDRDMYNSDTAITGPAMTRMSTEETTYLYTNPYYNMGAIACAIIGIVALYKFCNYEIVHGYYREYGYYNTTKTVARNKFHVALDKLGHSHDLYKFKLTGKLRQLRFNCMKNELRYLIKHNYTNMEKMPTSKKQIKRQYRKAINKIKANKVEYNRLYAKNGPLSKYQTQISNQIAKNEVLIEKNYDRILSMKNALHNKADMLRKPTFLQRCYAGRIVACVALVASVAMAVYEIYDLVNGGKTKETYSDIDMPLQMIDRTYPEGSKEINYVRYVAGLNKDGKKADLHNWKGDGWLNIYTTTDSDEGDPILAEDFGIRDSATDADPDMISVVRFGDSAAFDVTGNGGYLYFRKNALSADTKTEAEEPEETSESVDVDAGDAVSGDAADTEGTEGSVFGGAGMIWIILIIVVVAGIAAGTGVYVRKRKKSE